MPKTESRLLLDGQAVIAQNCDLSSGILAAIKEPGLVQSLSDSLQRSIFPYNSRWLSWSTDVDVVESPIDGDQYDRIYYTGDGVPKVRGTVSGVESEYVLGLPKPVVVPVCTTQAKDTVGWTRTWGYQYEESDGQISQLGTLTEGAYGGATVEQVTPGKQYRIETKPSRTTASASAVFVIWFDAYESDGSLMGRMYPQTSAYANNRDFYLNGAKGTGALDINVPSPQVVLDITYDTSRASEYQIDRYYRYAFVSGWGEVGPLSEPSLIIPVEPTQDCNLTGLEVVIPAYDPALTYKQGQGVRNGTHYYLANQNIDTAESFTSTHWDDLGETNPFNITKKRIYRTVTGDAGTFYKFVAEVAYSETSYLDTLADEDTVEEAKSSTWLSPPAGLTGLVAMPGGILAGFVDNTIFFCEPYQPHAWPRNYAQTVHFTIRGLGVNASGLVALTVNGNPYLLTGSHPAAMIQQKIDSTQSCESKKSIAVCGDISNAVIMYASPDGLTVIDGGVARVISQAFWTREQWQALSPSTMIGAFSEGRYFGFSDTTSIIFPLNNNMGIEPLTTTQTATGIYADLRTDLLYLIQGSSLNSWGTGTNNLTLTWKSKQYVYNRGGSFNFIRVRASSYANTVMAKVYANNALVATISILNDKTRRLPILRDETTWEIAVEAQDDIYEILLTTNMGDL